jgi:hypothetical protein
MKLGKQKSSGSLNGAKGGKTHMFGKSGVAPRQPGISAPVHKQPFNKAMNKGGGKHMAKKSGVRPSEPGKVTVAKSGAGNNKDFSVSGGSTHMFGRGTASNARPR